MVEGTDRDATGSGGRRQRRRGGEGADGRPADRGPLGLAIGLRAAERLDDPPAAHLPLAGRIATFWSRPEHRDVASWTEHADINAVMLAVALVPEGYVAL